MKYLATTFLLIWSVPALASNWEQTKNIADDIIHQGISHTFYCGCEYQSHGDNDGSGDITNITGCGYISPDTHSHRAGRIEWEHVVPASLMPARQFECWAGEGGSRSLCEKSDPVAQAMLFDLHNLVPSIGQVNALRSNDRYADLSNSANDFGSCPIKDSNGLFEPPDCLKGDVARIWLYMHIMYGVAIPADEMEMFADWATHDPVSPWESEREKRVAAYSRVNNPYVYRREPSSQGSCPWE